MPGKRLRRIFSFRGMGKNSHAQTFARSAAGADLLPVVRIVDEFGTGYLRSLAQRITPEAQADYVISTVHRAKGLEWKRVKVINDFLFKYVAGRLTVEEDELRLLYVACTRAQHVLDVSDLRDALLRLFR
ncbi:3'-5' exonuclease [Paraburkholderia franconis]|uniref:3'-5' exonuclease n=1 Tax=Paraburkholderia franconis TaxID=2654983 RepID=UPI001D11D0C3|nr:3'-5' exonuclease [Paraburkholderia franconis]